MKRFLAVLIKPSHYDDDGYVISWVRSAVPSNSLASVYGLVRECAEAKVLGDDVDLRIEAFDETNTVVPIDRLRRKLKKAGAGFVGLVGVQSNQFPRAVDIARQFRADGIPVVIGGFHAAGCMSMLTDEPEEIRFAREDLGCTIYAGEAEGRMDALLRDLHAGTPKPVYDWMKDLPGLDGSTVPYLTPKLVHRSAGKYTSFDSGRGCPFQCSFCTIINVQGRKSRYRTPDDIETIIRQNHSQGIRRYFITDDNFARNRNWEAILDRLIHLREEQKLRFKFIIQVDTLCHRIPGFIEKAARAGCNRVFIGLENIDPEALMGAKKRQNKIWEYRIMLQAWKDAGIATYAGYILGFPGDTPEKIRRNIEIIKSELPLDLIEFFYLTPLPGSEDHRTLLDKGEWMDPDLNKYDLNHRVSHHPTMSDEEWEKAYRDAWAQFYSDEHVETVLRRGVATGLKTRALFEGLGAFGSSIAFEGVHPLEAGVVRRKARRQRRHGMPIESPWTFYPRRLAEFYRTHRSWLTLYFRYKAIHDRVVADPASKTYTDKALEPVSDHEDETELMTTFGAAIPETYGAPKKKTPAAAGIADAAE